MIIFTKKNYMISKFPKIMGILNITPDSFSDGGDYFSIDNAVKHGIELFKQGADIIDIGAESTRPGSTPVSTDEELNRVIPVIKALKKEIPDICISIDTTKCDVAFEAVINGAEYINDISALEYEPKIAEIAAKYNVWLILMHIQGNPKNMQINPMYSNIVNEIFNYLKQKIILAKSYGVNKIIADVGIGFGKTLEHNIELLRNLDKFKELELPLLIGISRKTFIGKILDIDIPKNRDLGTVLLHSLLLNTGIDFIRVHNVNYLVQLKKIYSALNGF